MLGFGLDLGFRFSITLLAHRSISLTKFAKPATCFALSVFDVTFTKFLGPKLERSIGFPSSGFLTLETGETRLKKLKRLEFFYKDDDLIM